MGVLPSVKHPPLTATRKKHRLSLPWDFLGGGGVPRTFVQSPNRPHTKRDVIYGLHPQERGEPLRRRAGGGEEAVFVGGVVEGSDVGLEGGS